MLSKDREFHFIGDLKIKKSKLLKPNTMPKDDEVNWMFIELNGNNRCSFVYEIIDPANAQYNVIFKIKLAITFYDLVKNELKLDNFYSVMRGEEKVGNVKLTKYLL